MRELGSDSSNPENYIVPYLLPGMTEEQEYSAIASYNRKATRGLKRIAPRLCPGKKLNMKMARHTLAMVLLRAGARMDLIRQILGHASLVTTQAYVDSIDLGELTESMKLATDFSEYANHMQKQNPIHANLHEPGF